MHNIAVLAARLLHDCPDAPWVWVPSKPDLWAVVFHARGMYDWSFPLDRRS